MRTRTVIGWALTALGIGFWAACLAVWQPAVVGRSGAASFAVLPPVDAAKTKIAFWANDVRWAAMVLALGGLVLLAASLARRWTYAGLFVAWVAADLVLDYVGANGWVIAGAATAVVAGVLVLATLLTSGENSRLPALGLVYSGLSVSVAGLLFAGSWPWLAPTPAQALVAPTVIAVLLIGAGVVTALATRPAVSPARTIVGGVVGLVAASFVVASAVVSPSGSGDLQVPYPFAIAAVAAVVAAIMVVARGFGRLPVDRVVTVSIVGVLLVVAWLAEIVQLFLSAYVSSVVYSVTDDSATEDALGIMLMAVGIGLLLGIIASIPTWVAVAPVSSPRPGDASVHIGP